MIIKTFYDNCFHKVEVKEGDIIKIYCKDNRKNWLTLATGQVIRRHFKEGFIACGQSTWGIINSNKFEPFINFSSNYTKVEVL